MSVSCPPGLPLNIAAIAVVVLCIAGGPASAATFNFKCITNNLAGDCTIGEAAFQVAITDPGGGFIDFTFTRSGADAANLAAVYFDDDSLLKLTSVAGSPGVAFTGGQASPRNLPGGKSIFPEFDATAGLVAKANNPAPKNGINDNADWLIITFKLLNGASIADAVNAMGTDLRIGIHVTAYESGGSESLISSFKNPVISTAVPVPAAAWLFGSALVFLGWIRRRTTE